MKVNLSSSNCRWKMSPKDPSVALMAARIPVSSTRGTVMETSENSTP